MNIRVLYNIDSNGSAYFFDIGTHDEIYKKWYKKWCFTSPHLGTKIGLMAQTQATQIKVTLPKELYLLVKNKADRFGLNLASYMRHLAITDSKDDFPTYPMTAKQERILDKALEDHKNGKTLRVKNVSDWLKNM